MESEELMPQSESEENKTVQEKIPKKIYPQRFREEWKEREEYAPWLREVADSPQEAWCIYCRCTMKAHFKGIEHHWKSKKHEKNHERWKASGGTIMDELDMFNGRSYESPTKNSKNYEPSEIYTVVEPTKKEDHFDLFGRMIASYLRQMPSAVSMQTQKELMDVCISRMQTAIEPTVVVYHPAGS